MSSALNKKEGASAPSYIPNMNFYRGIICHSTDGLSRAISPESPPPFTGLAGRLIYNTRMFLLNLFKKN